MVPGRRPRGCTLAKGPENPHSALPALPRRKLESLVQRLVLEQVSGFAVGGSHSIAFKQDGSLRGWGANNKGQLGDGTSLGRDLPTENPLF